MILEITQSRLDKNPGLLIILSIFAILVTIGLIYLLVLSIKKESKKYHDEKAVFIEGLLTKSEMLAEISTYLSKATETTSFSLLSINLDGFSNVINAFGQSDADKVLHKIALNILDSLPKRTELSRFHEDQFYVFVRGEYSKNEIFHLAKDILQTIKKPLTLFNESTVVVTASIGIAFYPNHGRNIRELMDSLNIAQYLSKRNGGDTYTLYSKELKENESDNYEYYHQIKSAIKNKEFTLFFQPMINCRTNKVYGFEGLLRWVSAEHGVVAPNKFINILEQSGDITWVGEWGLDELSRVWTELKKKFPNEEFMLSLNLSPKQLFSETLAQEFQKINRKYRIPQKKITLEIAEFALFEKNDIVKKNIELLSELGFLIAVDGFGLDYASLTKLEQLPIDVIKLDNDFLNSENDNYLKEKFVNLLVDYASKNGKTVISEGVEDVPMMKKVISKNIEIMQGYYFSKPISFEDVNKYIENNAWMKYVNLKDTMIINEDSTTLNSLDETPAELDDSSKEEETLLDDDSHENDSLESNDIEDDKDDNVIEDEENIASGDNEEEINKEQNSIDEENE